VTDREAILELAKQITSTDRNRDYGEPEQNFEAIAGLWSAALRNKYVFQPHEVAMLMMLVKVARISTSPEVQDHWVDIAGYAACGGEVRPNGRSKP
jgi:Domain of unknown function (DUF6378)